MILACQRLPKKPAYIPKARLRGTKALGLTFERKVGLVLGRLFSEVHSGVWFEYQTLDKVAVCQPDHFAVLSDKIILVECKLSEKIEAWVKMRELYAPILEQHYARPVARVQAARHLRSGLPVVLDVRRVVGGGEYLWHVLT